MQKETSTHVLYTGTILCVDCLCGAVHTTQRQRAFNDGRKVCREPSPRHLRGLGYGIEMALRIGRNVLAPTGNDWGGVMVPIESKSKQGKTKTQIGK